MRTERRMKMSSWLKTFVILSDAPDTPHDVMRDHIRQGLETRDVGDQAAAVVAARGIAESIRVETGDCTAFDCMDRYDWPGFIAAWDRAEDLYANTVEGQIKPCCSKSRAENPRN